MCCTCSNCCISCWWRRAAQCFSCCIYFLQVATRSAVLYLLYSFLAGGDAQRGALLVVFISCRWRRAARCCTSCWQTWPWWTLCTSSACRGSSRCSPQPSTCSSTSAAARRYGLKAYHVNVHAGTGLKHAMSMYTQVRA